MDTQNKAGHGFGTAPVFLAAVSTILGAILFLRFGYAVGHTGLMGALMLIVIGHAITIPTGLAVAEIATNLKVEGGGEYFIISRSFGATVGGAIGITLYVSQAVSIAFYLIAFAESFRALFPLIEAQFGFIPDARMISIPAALGLSALIIKKGANLGVSALWGVVIILGISLSMFFLGSPTEAATGQMMLFGTTQNPDSFFIVFAIVFPAFTGMTAGVGLSGDLKNPRKSIPLGTLSGTLVGMLVYILIVFKLSYSASPDELATDQFIMSRIALWGPIIPIGLAAASISSAIGSILVAPRTLQALAADKNLPLPKWNSILSSGKGESNEPINATILTTVIVLLFVSLGNVDFVAQIISMFFMITYGSLCAISFLEHFAGNPSYRPTFRTKWYLSLIGAIASFVMMFQMNGLYATLSVLTMGLLYLLVSRVHVNERGLTTVIKGVLFQMTRQLQVLIQKKQAEVDMSNWRPSFIAISRHSFSRLGPFDLLRWISHYYGFGSFIHFIEGPLTPESNNESKMVLARLIDQAQVSHAGLYVDTIISPSFKMAIASIVQIPGVAGMENNSIMFEFDADKPDDLTEIIEGCHFAAAAEHNICILRSSERHFGYKQKIDIWLTPGDLRNANLMIMLAYIMIGHPEWKGCELKLYMTFIRGEIGQDKDQIKEYIAKGRLMLSPKNIQLVPLDSENLFDDAVVQNSERSDLVITGFSLSKLQQDEGQFMKGFSAIKDILFVRAGQDILITKPEE